MQPLELLLADVRGRVGNVIENDKVNALVVERVIRLAEKLLIGFSAV